MIDETGIQPDQQIQKNQYGTIHLEPIPVDPPDASSSQQLTRGRRPEWLRVRAPDSPKYRELKGLFRGKQLHTVCEEAMCPNIGECWGRGTATFLLMGDTCTRSCGFCKIKTGRPGLLDPEEPRHVGESVRAMNLHQCQPGRTERWRGLGLCRKYSLDSPASAWLHC
jgi:lipoyl synthase